MTEYIFTICIAVASVLSLIISIYVNIILRKEYKRKVTPDIDVDFMINAEKMIQEFLSSSKIDDSSTISKIATILKVKENGEVVSLNVQAEISAPDVDGFRYVSYRRGLSSEEKTFALAHECAHILLGHATPATRPDGHNKPTEDQMADYTAAALLMPVKRVIGELESKKYFVSNYRTRRKILNELCNTFGFSEILVLRRIKEIQILSSDMNGRKLLYA